MASTIFQSLGSPGYFLESTEREFDLSGGQRYRQEYFGQKSYLDPLKAGFDASGAATYMVPDGRLYRLTVILGIESFTAPENEQAQASWDLTTEWINEDVYASPKIQQEPIIPWSPAITKPPPAASTWPPVPDGPTAPEGSVTDDQIKLIENALAAHKRGSQDESETWEGYLIYGLTGGDVEGFPVDVHPNDRARALFAQRRLGLEYDQVTRPTLIHTRTYSPIYNPPIDGGDTRRPRTQMEVDRQIYSTNYLVAALDIPAITQSRLPPSTNPRPKNTAWAWKPSELRTTFDRGSNRISETASFVFSAWTTLTHTLVS